MNTLTAKPCGFQMGQTHPKPMKSPPFKILVTALFIATCAHLQARFVTLTVNNNVAAGPISLLAELTIQSNEVATVRFTTTINSISAVSLTIIKDGITVGSPADSGAGAVIAGPAVVQVRPATSVDRGFC